MKALAFKPKFRAAADVLAENRTGLDVVQIVLLLRQGALGSLATAVGSENQNIQGVDLL
jgi:hypothetical protein